MRRRQIRHRSRRRARQCRRARRARDPTAETAIPADRAASFRAAKSRRSPAARRTRPAACGRATQHRVASKIAPSRPMPIRKLVGNSMMPMRLGEHKKQERPRGMSDTASYATPAPTRSPLVMTHHHLHSSPETCHWGFFEAKLKPVLTIASGDEVTIDTISGGPDVVPDRKPISRSARTRRGSRQKRADGARPHPDRPGRDRRRRARRRAGGRDSRRPAPAGLGLQSDPAAGRHPARRFPRNPAAEHSARPRSGWSAGCHGGSICRWRRSSA